MAETPLSPGTPGSPGTPEPSGAAAEPVAGAPESGEAGGSDSSVPLPPEEEPTVEGWSGTPTAVSAEEAIARPATGPIEVSLTPAPAAGAEPPAAALPPVEPTTPAPADAAPLTPPEPPASTGSATPETAAPVEPAAPAAVPEPAPTPTPTPLSVADPEPEPAPTPALVTPTIATTLEIPAAPGAAASDGGEFDLLVQKLRTWFDEADIGGHWQKLRGPLKGLALVLVVVLALRLYARVVGTIDGIPIVSGLLELTGLIYLLWFSSTRLVRTSERERVLADWKQRWQSFSGRS